LHLVDALVTRETYEAIIIG